VIARLRLDCDVGIYVITAGTADESDGCCDIVTVLRFQLQHDESSNLRRANPMFFDRTTTGHVRFLVDDS